MCFKKKKKKAQEYLTDLNLGFCLVSGNHTGYADIKWCSCALVYIKYMY